MKNNQFIHQINEKMHHVRQTLAHKCPIVFGPPQSNKPVSPYLVYGSIATTICVIFFLSLPTILTERKLSKLGYSSQAISQIQALDLSKKIQESYLYSDKLNEVFENQLNVDVTYLPLYTIYDVVEDNTKLMYQRLIVKGYDQDEILSLMGQLKDFELSVLLTFQKLDNIQAYIDDCLAHPENSKEAFTLSNNYAKPYDETAIHPTDGSNVNMLVNKFNYLSADYYPNGLNELSVRYGASGVSLAQEASTALAQMVDKFATLGYSTGFYVSSGYRDYTSQENIYQSYVAQHGQENADSLATRAGFSEHQTGLALDLASTDYGKEFKDTNEFTWVAANCYDYGFILRYPQGKEYITHIGYEPWHYRYVGVDIATKIKESGLTYDEYYELYLRPLPNNIAELITANQQEAIENAKFAHENKPNTTIDPITNVKTTIEPTLPSEK